MATTAPRQSRSKQRRQYTPRTGRVLKRLRMSNSKLRVSLFRSRRRKEDATMTKEQLVRHASRFLSKQALEIFRVQVYLQPLNKYGRRWPDEYKAFAMNLYFYSPKEYIYPSKLLLLPSVRSLQNWLQDVVVEPGVMPTVLATLKKKMDWCLKDRACTLLFNAISLKSHLYYDI